MKWLSHCHPSLKTGIETEKKQRNDEYKMRQRKKMRGESKNLNKEKRWELKNHEVKSILT